MESLHIYGNKDEYKSYMTEHNLYNKDPIVITHEEGHKFPRAINDDDFDKLKIFVKKHFTTKFGEEEPFNIPVEKFNF